MPTLLPSADRGQMHEAGCLEVSCGTLCHPHAWLPRGANCTSCYCQYTRAMKQSYDVGAIKYSDFRGKHCLSSMGTEASAGVITSTGMRIHVRTQYHIAGTKKYQDRYHSMINTRCQAAGSCLRRPSLRPSATVAAVPAAVHRCAQAVRPSPRNPTSVEESEPPQAD